MSEFITEFIIFMRKHGIGPADSSEIIGDDKRRRYTIDGDHRSKKNGSYQLSIESGFAYGWARSFVEGETRKWHSKANKKYTAEERAEWDRNLKEKKSARKKQDAAEHAEAAEKSKLIWNAAKRGPHGYLDRKQIDEAGSRTIKNALVVPAYKNGEISSLQFISEDGDKRFKTDGDIKGAYGSIGKDTTKIYISTGFATAKSIYKAVHPYVSIWAFNDGNLKPVAKAIRKKYPDAEIIICADMDQWTFINKERPKGINRHDVPADDPRWEEWKFQGRLFNSGLEKSTEAAIAIDARIIEPDFPFDCPEKFTDFNDYDIAHGVDALRERLENHRSPQTDQIGDSLEGGPPDVAIEDSSPPPLDLPPDYYEYNDAGYVPEMYGQEFESTELAESDDWKELLHCDVHGKVVKSSMKNTILFLQHHNHYAKMIRYNKFNHQIMIHKCPCYRCLETI